MLLKQDWYSRIGFNVIPYHGGKAQLSKRIIDMMPDHLHYVEAFVGGGSVFWNKRCSEIESINDAFGLITNVYRVFSQKDKFDEFLHYLETTPLSEACFTPVRNLEEPTTACAKSAFQFWYALRNSFVGKSGQYGYSAIEDFSKRYFSSKTHFINNRNVILRRLENVQIFQRDALRLIKCVDEFRTLFYIDPPYPNAAHGYYPKYTLDDYFELLEALPTLKGKFILSCFRCDGDADFFKAFNVCKYEFVGNSSSMKAGAIRPSKVETIVTNF